MDVTLNNKSCEQAEYLQENIRTEKLNLVPCVPVGFDKESDSSYHVHFTVDGLLSWSSHQPDLENAQRAYDQAVQITRLFNAARKEKTMTTEEKLEKAMNLLWRAVATEMSAAPDKTWFQEYFALTGEHMILTDEGWEPGGERETYQPGEVLEEVNSPDRPNV